MVFEFWFFVLLGCCDAEILVGVVFGCSLGLGGFSNLVVFWLDLLVAGWF